MSSRRHIFRNNNKIFQQDKMEPDRHIIVNNTQNIRTVPLPYKLKMNYLLFDRRWIFAIRNIGVFAYMNTAIISSLHTLTYQSTL